jgi:hypothetical protein
MQYKIEAPSRIRLLPERWNLRLLDAQGQWIDVLRGYQSHEVVEVAAELQAMIRRHAGA